jgi:hypothetical protein
LLQFWRGSPLTRAPGGHAHQVLDADPECLCQRRELRDRDSQLAAFVMSERLLGDAERFGNLRLRKALGFARSGDALTQVDIESFVAATMAKSGSWGELSIGLVLLGRVDNTL